MDTAGLDPALYQQLVNSGGDLQQLQAKIAQQQGIAKLIQQQSDNIGQTTSFRNSVGGTTIAGGGGWGSALAKGLAGAAGGYMQGQAMQNQQGVAPIMNSQNQSVLAALLKQRGLGNAPASTDLGGD